MQIVQQPRAEGLAISCPPSRKMSFGFSAGDFIAAATLVKDIVVCLKDTGGSASEYQELMLELDTLRLALDKIEHLNVSEERQLATNAIKVAALNCQYVLRDSLTKLRKYKGLEHGTDGGGWIRSSAKKAQWEVAMKKDIQDLRAYLAAHTNSLNIRLVTEGLYETPIQTKTASLSSTGKRLLYPPRRIGNGT